jgi:hypothetical protein
MTSELIIENAKYSDSAFYTCKYDSVHKKSLITVVNESMLGDLNFLKNYIFNFVENFQGPGPASIRYEISRGGKTAFDKFFTLLLFLYILVLN